MPQLTRMYLPDLPRGLDAIFRKLEKVAERVLRYCPQGRPRKFGWGKNAVGKAIEVSFPFSNFDRGWLMPVTVFNALLR